VTVGRARPAAHARPLRPRSQGDVAEYAPKSLAAAVATAVRLLKEPVPAPPAGGEASAAGAGAGASAASSAASSHGAGGRGVAKREVRGVQLNMDGLLGKRETEDEYIRALLLVDGVTSVTIDRVRRASATTPKSHHATVAHA